MPRSTYLRLTATHDITDVARFVAPALGIRAGRLINRFRRGPITAGPYTPREATALARMLAVFGVRCRAEHGAERRPRPTPRVKRAWRALRARHRAQRSQQMGTI